MGENLEKAIFAGGCFWCMEQVFDTVSGVENVVSGYIGGDTEDPTYEEVCSGNTGHFEALEVTFNPERVTYDHLLKVFWRNIDPLDGGGQFNDRGSQYYTAIFYLDEIQKEAAEYSKKEVARKLNASIATQILPATHFFEAEAFHQQYYKKHKVQYDMYKYGSGRLEGLKCIWRD